MGRLKGYIRKQESLRTNENSSKRVCHYELYTFTGTELIRYSAEGLVILWGAGYLFYHSWIVCVCLSGLLIWYLRVRKSHCIKKRRQTLILEFREGLQALSAALQAGYSIENAWLETAHDMDLILDESSAFLKELHYMMKQMRLNQPLEQLLQDFGERSGVEDIKNFTVIFTTARKSGGDFVGIIRNTVQIMGEKIEVQQEIETMIAAKRLEYRIMSVVPAAIICYMRISFPDFSNILYGNPLGIGIMTVCLAVYVAAFLAGSRMIEIEV